MQGQLDTYAILSLGNGFLQGNLERTFKFSVNFPDDNLRKQNEVIRSDLQEGQERPS